MLNPKKFFNRTKGGPAYYKWAVEEFRIRAAAAHAALESLNSRKAAERDAELATWIGEFWQDWKKDTTAIEDTREEWANLQKEWLEKRNRTADEFRQRRAELIAEFDAEERTLKRDYLEAYKDAERALADAKAATSPEQAARVERIAELQEEINVLKTKLSALSDELRQEKDKLRTAPQEESINRNQILHNLKVDHQTDLSDLKERKARALKELTEERTEKLEAVEAQIKEARNDFRQWRDNERAKAAQQNSVAYQAKKAEMLMLKETKAKEIGERLSDKYASEKLVYEEEERRIAEEVKLAVERKLEEDLAAEENAAEKTLNNKNDAVIKAHARRERLDMRRAEREDRETLADQGFYTDPYLGTYVETTPEEARAAIAKFEKEGAYDTDLLLLDDTEVEEEEPEEEEEPYANWDPRLPKPTGNMGSILGRRKYLASLSTEERAIYEARYGVQSNISEKSKFLMRLNEQEAAGRAKLKARTMGEEIDE